MNSGSGETVASSCDYCGRENPDRLPACTGCGTPLTTALAPVEDTPDRKSMVLAILLALILGPLGLFYVRAWWPACIMIAINIPLVVSGNGGLHISVLGRIISVAWAWYAVTHWNENQGEQDETVRLLNEAAGLESVDKAKAINAYEAIIRLYPDTAASREATRNIETLKGLQG